MVDGRDGIALIARTARQTAGAGMGKNGRWHEMAAGEAEAVMAVAAVRRWRPGGRPDATGSGYTRPASSIIIYATCHHTIKLRSDLYCICFKF